MAPLFLKIQFYTSRLDASSQILQAEQYIPKGGDDNSSPLQFTSDLLKKHKISPKTCELWLHMIYEA